MGYEKKDVYRENGSSKEVFLALFPENHVKYKLD